MSNEIRVRFAPSPTGYLHVGGLRTALYNYLYARKVGGKFILRIEDTDRTRYVEGAVENLINSLKEVGLDFDEGPEVGGEFGPYFQSERTELYQKHAEELLEAGKAYRCFCTSEDLQKMREERQAQGLDTRYDGRCRNLTEEEIKAKMDAGKPFVIREKLPTEGEIFFYDLVRDKVTFPWDMVDDQVLIKSDGYPTYHFANVIDDHYMQISHVIRGEEWLSSVPKHLFLYEAFGWKPPKMAHLPLLLNSDKSKLSKRQGDVAVEDYLAKGYIPHALVNFVALLGWHAKGDQELFEMDELIKAFSLKRINKAGAVFDVEKLQWMNSHYMKNMKLSKIAELAKPFVEKAGYDISDDKKYLAAIKFARERVALLTELTEEIKPFYITPEISEEYTELAAEENSQNIFNFWASKLAGKDIWQEDEINALIKETTTATGAKGKNLYFPIRLALFGTVHGPEIPLIIGLIGTNEAIKRFRNLIK